MNIAWVFVIIVVCAYLIGSISFARIFSWAFAKKDITKVGSHNPGTMNMLRTRGFGEAILTLVMDAIKCGLPALISYFVVKHFYVGYGDLAYFISGVSAIVGHCFPVYYNFKGGKGVACTFGLFTFNPHFYWMSLIAFVVCFLLMLFVIKYGSVISFIYILSMAITSTTLFSVWSVPHLVPILVIIWCIVVLIFSLHHKNIVRLFTGKENKVDLMSKICKKKTAVVVEEGDDKGEEIVIEENSHTNDKTTENMNKNNDSKHE